METAGNQEVDAAHSIPKVQNIAKTENLEGRSQEPLEKEEGCFEDELVEEGRLEDELFEGWLLPGGRGADGRGSHREEGVCGADGASSVEDGVRAQRQR